MIELDRNLDETRARLAMNSGKTRQSARNSAFVRYDGREKTRIWVSTNVRGDAGETESA